MNVPLTDPSEEVMVKDVDGSWKLYRGGVLVERPSALVAPNPPARPFIATPSVVAPPTPPTPPQPVVSEPNPSLPSAGPSRAMHDILPPHTLVGPVDELRMTLQDYEHLAPTAAERIARVRDKIDQLEGQEYAKRLEGISAWKGSDVYHLYIVLGQESVLSGTSIEETIERKKKAGETVLSVDDFHAINELNHQLRN